MGGDETSTERTKSWQITTKTKRQSSKPHASLMFLTNDRVLIQTMKVQVIQMQWSNVSKIASMQDLSQSRNKYDNIQHQRQKQTIGM